MSGHGGPTLPPRTARTRARAGIGAQGTGTASDPAAVYAGLPAGNDATEVMLSRLVKRMGWGGYPWPTNGAQAWSSDVNDAIPAGYTYLAQLVAHDFVENTVQLPLIADFPGRLQRDYRTQRLLLDTIYGGGPARDPLPYGVATAGSPERCLFRLGHVRSQEPPSFQMDPPPPLLDQPARDIPRVRCPHLSDRPADKATPDVLIADARNDQHLIISQLTALFHELHNILFQKVRALQDVPGSGMVDLLNFPLPEEFASTAVFRVAQDDMAFLQTRKLVASIYRRIVLDDLMPRLLEPGIYAYYTDPHRVFPRDFFYQDDDQRVPTDFSHAVFRFGHVMARFSYKLNGQLDHNPSIKALLDRSSAKRRDLLPLAADWLIDWSHFFEMGDGKTVNYARRIAPYVAFGPLVHDAAVPPEKDREGGLFYRDFMRGYESGVSTVEVLIESLPASARNRSELLKNSNLREHEIGQWLKHGPDVGLLPHEMISLSKNPPLLLFVLFEAAHTQAGRRLGILGSTLVADVFFRALQVNRSVIEDDPAVPVLAQQIFGSAIPATMPALIAYLRSQGGLADVVVDGHGPVA